MIKTLGNSKMIKHSYFPFPFQLYFLLFKTSFLFFKVLNNPVTFVY